MKEVKHPAKYTDALPPVFECLAKVAVLAFTSGSLFFKF